MGRHMPMSHAVAAGVPMDGTVGAVSMPVDAAGEPMDAGAVGHGMLIDHAGVVGHAADGPGGLVAPEHC